MAAEWCAIQRDAARTMSAEVENQVTDIATRIAATATVQVGDISGRINCAKTAVKNLHLVGYGNWNGEGLGNADEGGGLCQTHCPDSRGLCRRDSAALRMDVRGIKAAELFKLRDEKNLAVTLGP